MNRINNNITADGVLSETAKPCLPNKWDKEADVVILGYGATGAIAAITVAEAGGKVILLEKAPEAGGSSSVSTGGMRCIDNASQAAKYIKSVGLGSIDNEIARVFAEIWVEMKQ